MTDCTYCGSRWHSEVEHVQAQIRGGVATKPACKACNRSKGAKTLRDWLIWVKDNNPYRWNRIVEHNHGKRSQIAKQVRTIRDMN